MRRTQSAVLLGAGVLICLVALAADGLGLGTHPGLGAWQLLGAVAGVVLAAAGMITLKRSR
jgi:hypothetical protein